MPVVTAIRPTPAPSAEHASNWLFLPLGPVDCPELATCKPTEIAAGRTPTVLTTAAWAGDKTKLPVWIPVRFPHRDFDRLLRTDNAYGWYACVFSAPPTAGTQGLILRLGMIDDADVAYLNGVQVGATGDVVQKVSAWNVDREYRVPPGVAREENNLLLVRVLDKTGLGGILGIPTTTVPLVPAGGQWQFSPLKPAVSATSANSAAPDLNALTELPGDFPSTLAGNSLTWMETALPDNGWNARLGNRPAYGVYRLSFTVEALPTGEADLVLDLGPLYDVAAVFVNGKRTGLIGRFPVPGKSAFVETATAARCLLPRRFVRPGANELTVVVYNDTALGGLPGIPGVLLQPEWALPSLQRELRQIEVELFSGRKSSVTSRLTALLARRDLPPVDSASVLSLAVYAAWLDWRDTGNADALRQALAHAAKIFVQHPDECISQSAHQALCDILRTAERTPEVAAIVREVFPHFAEGCAALGADRETRGDWVMHYGSGGWVLAAAATVGDWTSVGNPPKPVYRKDIPGKRETPRHWLATANRESADPDALLMPARWQAPLAALAAESPACNSLQPLLRGQPVRRAAWWDDRGETHPFDENGPDLLITLTLPSKAAMLVTFNQFDQDWRQTLHPRTGGILLFDVNGAFVNAVWSGACDTSVYQRFLVSGHKSATARFPKFRGACAAVNGVFLDRTESPAGAAVLDLPGLWAAIGEIAAGKASATALRPFRAAVLADSAPVTTAAAFDRELGRFDSPAALHRLGLALRETELPLRWIYLVYTHLLRLGPTVPKTELTAALADGFRRFEEPQLAPLRVWLLRAWTQQGNAATPAYAFALRDLAPDLAAVAAVPVPPVPAKTVP